MSGSHYSIYFKYLVSVSHNGTLSSVGTLKCHCNANKCCVSFQNFAAGSMENEQSAIVIPVNGAISMSSCCERTVSDRKCVDSGSPRDTVNV